MVYWCVVTIYEGIKMVEVGGIEICYFYNFLNRLILRYNLLFTMKFQFLFGFICFWKIRVFLPQLSTNLAQKSLEVNPPL